MKKLDDILFELKPPKVVVKPRNPTKEEKKKAKLLEQIINHAYETNHNGITTKYMKLMKMHADNIVAEELYGIKVSWEATQRAIDRLTNEEVKKN